VYTWRRGQSTCVIHGATCSGASSALPTWFFFAVRLLICVSRDAAGLTAQKSRSGSRVVTATTFGSSCCCVCVWLCRIAELVYIISTHNRQNVSGPNVASSKSWTCVIYVVPHDRHYIFPIAQPLLSQTTLAFSFGWHEGRSFSPGLKYFFAE
jgi:hypothetical protein